MSAKKAPKRRKRSVFWRALRRYVAFKIRTRVRVVRTRVKTALGPKVVAKASTHWADGEDLKPRIQPYPWRHYVAPDDLEVYEADIGGYVFEFELMPESRVELTQAAYDAAAVHLGPYVDSQPLNYIRAVSDAALEILPEPIRS